MPVDMSASSLMPAAMLAMILWRAYAASAADADTLIFAASICHDTPRETAMPRAAAALRYADAALSACHADVMLRAA